jgi:hypothetical protein
MKTIFKTGGIFLMSFIFITMFSQDSLSEMEKLFYLEGKWNSMLNDSSNVTWTFEKVSLGKALYSKGILNKKENSIYQADALWTYAFGEKKVIILEVNSIHIIKIQKGSFDSNNLLKLKWTENCFPEKVKQETIIHLVNKDTLIMKMKIYDDKNNFETQYIFERIR